MKRFVSLQDTIAGFRAILDSKCDEMNEEAFYMVGGLDEAQAKDKKMRSK